MLPNITAFIFARGGSQGIKKKNLQKIGNKTLLEHSISTAMKVKRVSKKSSKRSSSKRTSSKRTSKKSIKVKKPSKKNNLIDKYLNSGNVLDI